MQRESRVKKTLLNARVNLIFYFLTLLLSFFSRKIFLNSLGAEFIGLTGTLQNLLGFLNLAELGIGTAIGYVLYKPLFEQNRVKINEIISVFGYMYRWIGLIILGGGCLLACFLPLIFPATDFDFGIIYFAYFAFLASSLIGYFANYKQTLLGADQKNYVVTAYFQTATIVKTLIQMASAYYTGSYYLWVGIELVFGVIHSLILNWKINRVYPWLKSEVKRGKELMREYPEVMRYTRQVFVHKIGVFTQFQTTPFLIYAFVSLKTVTYYGNYTIITDKLAVFINNFLGSTGAGVGNLIAEGDTSRALQIFWELFALRFLIAGTFIFALYHLLEPFISIWIGPMYILDKSILVLLLANFFLSLTRGATDQFLNGYGLFYDIWAPLTESGIFIVVALIGGYFWGLLGILLGQTISLLIIVFTWKPIFLFSKGFKLPLHRYWFTFLKYIGITGIAFYATAWVVKQINFINYQSGYYAWAIYAAIITLLFMVIDYVLLLLLTQGMRNLSIRILKNRSFK